MSTTLSHIHEVHETDDPGEVNQFMWKGGWKLLGVFQRATVADGRQAAWVLYVLGRGDTSRGHHDIESVDTVNCPDADKALKNGAVLLKVITQQDSEGEFARFIIGRPREAA
jgi:hypothetical protein